MLRSSVRAATGVISKCSMSTQASSILFVSCHRALTQSCRRDAYLRLGSGRCSWMGLCHSTTRLYSNSMTDVGVEELDCLLQEGRVQLFDVREPNELLDTGKIPRSVNIPRMLACV